MNEIITLVTLTVTVGFNFYLLWIIRRLGKENLKLYQQQQELMEQHIKNKEEHNKQLCYYHNQLKEFKKAYGIVDNMDDRNGPQHLN